jgi:MFS family permease
MTPASVAPAAQPTAVSTAAIDQAAQRSLRRSPVSPTAGLFLFASITLFFLAASSAPTPLYAVYSAHWGFSPITTTVVFGVYAVAVLVALLFVGSLSDHIGRRPVLLAAIAVQILAMVVFTTANGVTELFVARVVQGLSTGSALGAVGAGMLDIHRERGTMANAVAPILGTATGALLSGIFVQYLPVPTHLIYLTLIAVFVVQAAGILLMAETAQPRPGAWQSLRIQVGLPTEVRSAFFAAAPALVALWALPGFYASLGPALTRIITGSASPVLGGLGLAVLAGGGAASVLLTARVRPDRQMVLGTIGLLIGVALTLVSVDELSTALFFVGTAISGAGFGGAFQGAIRTIIPLARPHERSGVLSLLFVVSYLALGVPAVIGGYLVVHDGGLLSTARTYAIAVLVLASLALVGNLARSKAVRGVFAQTRTTAVTSTCTCSAGYGGSSSS